MGLNSNILVKPDGEFRKRVVLEEKLDNEKSDMVPTRFTHKYKLNPFKNDFFEIVITKNGKRRMKKFITKSNNMMDMDTGELHNTVIGVAEKVDNRTFVKIYKQNMRTIFGLSGGATKLLMYISLNLAQNSDLIEIWPEEICKELSMSDSTLYNMIKELVNSNILARHIRPSKFFINPIYIYNGDTMTIIKQYERDDYDKVEQDKVLENVADQKRKMSYLREKWEEKINEEGEKFENGGSDMDDVEELPRDEVVTSNE